VESEVIMQIQWDGLTQGGMRLEEIRFKLGFLKRKDFVKIFPLDLSDYCRIVRWYERLSIPRLVLLFSRLIEYGAYNRFEAVLADLDLFDDAHIYIPQQKTQQKDCVIKILRQVYDGCNLVA
jgi:hypothetical protein